MTASAVLHRALQKVVGHDPGHQSLRRAGRVLIVAGGLFTLLFQVFDEPVAATFALFGGFAMSGFADFGGPPASRTRAYIALALTGAVFVVIGTALSQTAWAAALVMFVIGFAVRFIGFFGGAYQAAVSPAILAYVLAATVPADTSEIPDRLLGWLLAGALATVVALVCWPRRERMRLNDAAVVAARALADVVERLPDEAGVPSDLAARAERSLAALNAASSVAIRPSGPGTTDAALRFLIDELHQIGNRALGPALGPWSLPKSEARSLADVAARSLREAADALEGGGPSPDAAALALERQSQQDMLFERVGELLHAGGSGEDALDLLDAMFTIRVIAFTSVSVAANSAIAMGDEPPMDDRLRVPLELPPDMHHRLWVLARSYFTPRSVWFQDSMRAGVALGIAVLVADTLAVQHAFWVVLGTLSVLRSNAFDTGSTAIQAAIGTAAGFAISALLFAVVGMDTPALWAIGLLAIFFAAYAPQAIGFLVGQAAFTVTVVVVFNLIEPEGWRTGLVRIEDIFIGAGISLVIGFLFWPRRADGLLRTSVAALYRDLAALVPETVAGLRRGSVSEAAVRADVRDSERRAGAAYVQLLEETSRTPERARQWATILRLAVATRAGADFVVRIGQKVTTGDCPAAFDALEEEADRLSGALVRVVTTIAHEGDTPLVALNLGAGIATSTRNGLVACLTAHADDGNLQTCAAAAFAREWLCTVATQLGTTFTASNAAAPGCDSAHPESTRTPSQPGR